MAFLKTEITDKDTKMNKLLTILKQFVQPEKEKQLISELKQEWGVNDKSRQLTNIEEIVKSNFLTEQEKLDEI